MKEKFDDKFKSYTKKLVEEYRTLIFASEYEIDIKFEWEDSDNFAEIRIDTKYLNATLSIYKPLYKEYKANGKKAFAKIILHEICHLLTEPQYDDTMKIFNGKLLHNDTINDTRERQTQRVTNALWALLDK